MDAFFQDLIPGIQPGKSRSHRFRSGHIHRVEAESGFTCKHCHVFVSSASFLSGVQNRNHCPYCLWSCHLDLYSAGDRLSACKSPMKPIGLTVKGTHKKYGSTHGELMLVHLCTECGNLSINRIAADDVPETVFRVFETTKEFDLSFQMHLKVEGIRVLKADESDLVRKQLFGQNHPAFPASSL
jgi:hypothetical protein